MTPVPPPGYATAYYLPASSPNALDLCVLINFENALLQKANKCINNYPDPNLFCFLRRCQCFKCITMAEERECNCCHESEDRRMSSLLDEGIQCITENPGFQSVCLNPWVLETAYNSFKQSQRRIIAQKITTVITLNGKLFSR